MEGSEPSHPSLPPPLPVSVAFPPQVSGGWVPPPPFDYQPPNHVSIWPGFLLVGCMLVSMILVWVVIVVIMMVGDPSLMSDEKSMQSQLLSAKWLISALLGIQSLNIVLALVFGKCFKPGIKENLGLKNVSLSLKTILVCCVGTFLSGAILNLLVLFIGVPKGGSLGAIQDATQSMGIGSIILLIFVIGILPGVGEELIFRGFVQRRLLKRWPPLGAIAMTTLLFAFIHLDVIQSLLVLSIGGYIGWVAYRSNHVLLAIICHVVNNSFAVVMMLSAPDTNEGYRFNPTLLLHALWMLVVWGICTYLAHKWLPNAVSQIEDAPGPLNVAIIPQAVQSENFV